MLFCDTCNNMFYVKVADDQPDLIHYCKFCNNSITESAKEKGSILVIDDGKIDDNIRYRQYANKNIIHDPTLPRVNNIQCPNASCTKKTDQENEVIYIKYDFANMKYLYYCCHCEHFWRL